MKYEQTILLKNGKEAMIRNGDEALDKHVQNKKYGISRFVSC